MQNIARTCEMFLAHETFTIFSSMFGNKSSKKYFTSSLKVSRQDIGPYMFSQPSGVFTVFLSGIWDNATCEIHIQHVYLCLPDGETPLISTQERDCLQRACKVEVDRQDICSVRRLFANDAAQVQSTSSPMLIHMIDECRQRLGVKGSCPLSPCCCLLPLRDSDSSKAVPSCLRLEYGQGLEWRQGLGCSCCNTFTGIIKLSWVHTDIVRILALLGWRQTRSRGKTSAQWRGTVARTPAASSSDLDSGSAIREHVVG